MFDLNLLIELSVQADVQQTVQITTEVVKLTKECVITYLLIKKITK